MLFFILAWFALSVVALPAGLALLNLVRGPVLTRIGDRLIVAAWLGIGMTGATLLMVSLLFPLTPLVGGLVGCSLFIFSLMSTGVRDDLSKFRSVLSFQRVGVAAAIAFSVAVYMVRPVEYADTGLYHIQAIKWLNQYGAVPGLALIHGRLGFSSSWFALAAPFHFVKLAPRAAALMAGWELCWVFGHLSILFSYILKGRALFEDKFIAVAYILCLPFTIIPYSGASSSNDLPIAFLTLIVAWMILVVSNREKPGAGCSASDPSLIPLMLSAGAVTIKLSAMPLFATSFLFYLSRNSSSLKRILTGGAMSALIILPTLATNVITSGCPLYPSPFMCLDLPWAVGSDQAEKMTELIRTFARRGSYVMREDALDWIWFWLIGARQLLVYLMGSLIAAVYLLINSRRHREVQGRFWVLAIALLGSALVLYLAPGARFGVGFFILLPALAASLFPRTLYPLILIIPLLYDIDWQTRRIRLGLLIIAVFIYLYALLFRGKPLTKFVPTLSIAIASLLLVKTFATFMATNAVINLRERKNWLIPPEHFNLWRDEFIDKQVNDVKYKLTLIPHCDGKCWAAELPCTPCLTFENIRLRDPKRGLAAGVIRGD